MTEQMRINDWLDRYGLASGALPKGPRNAMTDVDGVLVGHVTLAGGDAQTGVTSKLDVVHPMKIAYSLCTRRQLHLQRVLVRFIERLAHHQAWHATLEHHMGIDAVHGSLKEKVPVVFFQFKHRVGLSHEVQTRQQLNDDDGQEFRSFHFVIIIRWHR